jgi:hypothetical protein
MGVIAMKVMGSGNGCLALGNALKKVRRPYHVETSRQVESTSLIRYAHGLPTSVERTNNEALTPNRYGCKSTAAST